MTRCVRGTGPRAEDVALLLYATHLALLMAWLHDDPPDGAHTCELLALVGNVLTMSRPFLDAPFAAMAVARLGRAIAPLFDRKRAASPPPDMLATPALSKPRTKPSTKAKAK